MNLTIFGIIVFILLLSNLFLGIWQAKKGNNFLTWKADPNNRNLLSIALSVTGTIVGGGMFLAVGQIGFEAGITGYFIGLIYFVALLIMGRFVSKIRELMDQYNADTLLELISQRYSKNVTILFAIVNLLMYGFLLAGQFVGMYFFAHYVFGLTNSMLPWYLVGFAAIIALIYPIFGGLRKDITTDLMQISLVSIAGIYFYWLLYSNNFVSKIPELPLEHLDGTGYGIFFLIGIILFLGPLFVIRMDVWQRIRTAKTDRDAKIGLTIGGIIAAIFYVLFTSIGMSAYSDGHTTGGDATLFWIFTTVDSDIFIAIVSGAFFFAVLSSADTFLNNSSLFASHLFFKNRWSVENNLSNKKSILFLTRTIAFIIGLMAILFAFIVADFVELIVGAFSLLLVFLPLVVSLLVEKWKDDYAAFYSSLLGVSCFILLFILWDPAQAFVPAVFLSIIIYIVIYNYNYRVKKRFPNEES